MNEVDLIWLIKDVGIAGLALYALIVSQRVKAAEDEGEQKDRAALLSVIQSLIAPIAELPGKMETMTGAILGGFETQWSKWDDAVARMSQATRRRDQTLAALERDVADVHKRTIRVGARVIRPYVDGQVTDLRAWIASSFSSAKAELLTELQGMAGQNPTPEQLTACVERALKPYLLEIGARLDALDTKAKQERTDDVEFSEPSNRPPDHLAGSGRTSRGTDTGDPG